MLFLKAIFSGLLNTGSTEWRTAGKELISKRTFRMPDSSYKDRLVGLKTLRRTFKDLDGDKKNTGGRFRILVLDANLNAFGLRKEYIMQVKKYKEDEIIGITKDVSFAYAKKWQSRFYLVLLSFFVLPATFFSKNRVQWALIFPEFVEVSATVNAAANMDVQHVHFFSPAEKDANLAYLVFKETSMQVTKHPSPGALISHHKHLQTDILAFSSNYQVEEYELKLKETIRASVTETWPPETSLAYADLYKNKNSNYENRFGFYSHGGWYRVKDGKTSGLFAKPAEEEKCLDILKDFMSSYPSDKIIIFLHPKEKNNMSETEAYYLKWFKKEQVVFYTDKLPSSHAFLKAETGIGSYSTILFERDYFGFKTLILREEDRDFPMKGTTFYENSFCSSAELVEKIKITQSKYA